MATKKQKTIELQVIDDRDEDGDGSIEIIHSVDGVSADIYEVESLDIEGSLKTLTKNGYSFLVSHKTLSLGTNNFKPNDPVFENIKILYGEKYGIQENNKIFAVPVYISQKDKVFSFSIDKKRSSPDGFIYKEITDKNFDVNKEIIDLKHCVSDYQKKLNEIKFKIDVFGLGTVDVSDVTIYPKSRKIDDIKKAALTEIGRGIMTQYMMDTEYQIKREIQKEIDTQKSRIEDLEDEDIYYDERKFDLYDSDAETKEDLSNFLYWNFYECVDFSKVNQKFIDDCNKIVEEYIKSSVDEIKIEFDKIINAPKTKEPEKPVVLSVDKRVYTPKKHVYPSIFDIPDEEEDLSMYPGNDPDFTTVNLKSPRGLPEKISVETKPKNKSKSIKKDKDLEIG